MNLRRVSHFLQATICFKKKSIFKTCPFCGNCAEISIYAVMAGINATAKKAFHVFALNEMRLPFFLQLTTPMLRLLLSATTGAAEAVLAALAALARRSWPTVITEGARRERGSLGPFPRRCGGGRGCRGRIRWRRGRARPTRRGGGRCSSRASPSTSASCSSSATGKSLAHCILDANDLA